MRDVCSHGNNHHYHGRVKLQDGAKDRVHVCLMVEGAEEERRKHAWELRGEMRKKKTSSERMMKIQPR